MTRAELVGQVASRCGLAAAEAGMVYAPAIAAMTLKELEVLLAGLREGRVDEARSAIREKMTPEQLAEEKALLSGKAFEMAERGADRWQLAGAFWMAVLRAGFLAALG